jgi:hypothetical protein
MQRMKLVRAAQMGVLPSRKVAAARRIRSQGGKKDSRKHKA